MEFYLKNVTAPWTLLVIDVVFVVDDDDNDDGYDKRHNVCAPVYPLKTIEKLQNHSSASNHMKREAKKKKKS